MEIKANAKGSRYIEVTEKHLETIKEYSLFHNLVGCDGYVDDTTLEKLRYNVRALLETGKSSDKDLLDLCFDVIYHRDMKALGLRNLMLLYISYNDGKELDIDGFSSEQMLFVDEENESEDKA
jgi:hypothetical protein